MPDNPRNNERPENDIFDIRELGRRLKEVVRTATKKNENPPSLRIMLEDGREVECSFRDNNRGTRRAALWKLVTSEGETVNALASSDALDDFIKGAFGASGKRCRFLKAESHASGDAEQEVIASVQPPRQEGVSQTPLSFNFLYLLTNIYRRFGKAPFERMYLAIEHDGEIQGFATIEKRGRRFSLVDDVLGKRVTLSAIPENRRAITRWLQDDFGIDPTLCAFRLADKAEKDAYEEEERAEIEIEAEGEEAEMPETESIEPVVAEVSSDITPQSKKQKRLHPKNRPKKKTRAQEKAKNARMELEEYLRVTEQCTTLAARMFSNMRYDDLETVIPTMIQLGSIRGANKNRLRNDLANNPDFALLRQFLGLFKDGRIFPVSSVSRHARAFSMPGTVHRPSPDSLKKLLELVKELYPAGAHNDPYRGVHAFNWAFYNDTRDVQGYYIVLFPDMDPLTFMAGIHSMGAERWVDIGSGRTYENPNSLIRSLPAMNPHIEMIGIDPSYDESLASGGDRILGRTRVGAAEGCSLMPGTAQDIPLSDASIDRVLSSFVFDKFNDTERFQGTQQAFREIARILKPGGEARLNPVHLSEVERSDSVLNVYFDVELVEEWEYDSGERGQRYGFVRATRKELSTEQFEILKRESEAWKNTHARS